MSNQRLGIEIAVEKVSFDPKGDLKENLQKNLDAATQGLYVKVAGFSIDFEQLGTAIQRKLNEATKGLTINLSGVGGANADISGIEKSLENLTSVVKRVGAGIQEALNKLNGERPRNEVQKITDALRALEGESSKFNAKGFKFEIKSDVAKPITDIKRLNDELAKLEGRYAKITDLAKKSHYFNPAVLSEEKAKRELLGINHKENLQKTTDMLEDVLAVKFSGKPTARGLADFIRENFDAAQKVIKEEAPKLKQQMQNLRLELEMASAEKPTKKLFDVGFYEKGSKTKMVSQVAADSEEEARKLAQEMVRNAGGGHAFDIQERTRYNETAALMKEYQKKEAILKKFGPKDAWQEAAILQGMTASLTTQLDVKDGLLPKSSMPTTQVSEAEVAKQRALVDKLFEKAVNSPEYLEAEKKRLIAQRAGSVRDWITAPAAAKPAAVVPPPPPPPAPREAPPIDTYFGSRGPRKPRTETPAPPAPPAPPAGGGGEGGGGEKPPKEPKEDRATVIMKRLTEALNLSEGAAKKMKAKIEAALKMEGVEQGLVKLSRYKDLLIQINGETSKLSKISDAVKQALADDPKADIKIFSRSKLDPQIRNVLRDTKELTDKAVINGVPKEALDALQQLRKDTGHALSNKLTNPDDLIQLKDRFLQLNAAVGNDTKILALGKAVDNLRSKYAYLGEAAEKFFNAPALTQNYGTDAKGFASAASVQKYGTAIGELRKNLEGLAADQKKIDDAWAVRDKVAKGWDKKEATDYVAARRRDYDAIASEERTEAQKNADLREMHATLQKQKKDEALKVAKETAAQIKQYEYEQDRQYEQKRIASIQKTLQGRLNNITEGTEQYNAQQAKLGKPGVSVDTLPVEAAIGKIKDGDTAAYAKTLVDDLKRQVKAQAQKGTFDFNFAGSIEKEADKVRKVQRDWANLVNQNPSYKFSLLDTSVDYTKPLEEVKARVKEIRREFELIQDTFKLDKAAAASMEALSKSTDNLRMFHKELEGQVNTFRNSLRNIKTGDQGKHDAVEDQISNIYRITKDIPGAPTLAQLRELKIQQKELNNLIKDFQQTASTKDVNPFADIFKGIPRMRATVQDLQGAINALNIDTKNLDGETWNSLTGKLKKYRMTLDETTGAVRNLSQIEQQLELYGAKSERKKSEIERIPQSYKGADVSGLRTMQEEIASLVQKGGGAAEVQNIAHKFKLLQEAIAKVKNEASMGVEPKFLDDLRRAEELAFSKIGDLRRDSKATSAALQEAMKTLSISLDDQKKINAATSAWGKYNQVIQDGLPVAKEANNIFSFLGDNMGKMALRLTQFYSMRYILFGISAEFREAAAAAMKFSQNIHDIAAISGASQTEMESLGKSILEIARSTRFTSDEVAGLMQLLAQAGVSAGELPTVALTVGQFASATGTKPEMAADLVTTGLNVFDIKAQDTIKVTNQLTAALNLSKLTSQGLGTAFNYLAPQAEELGMSMKQTLGIIATMAQAGIKPSTIGTGSSQLLKELSAPKPRFQNLLDYYGISSESVNPLKNDFADIVEVFSNATGKLGEQGVQVQHIMSALETRVGRALVTAMSMGSASFRGMTDAIAGSNAAWIAFYKSMDGAEARMNQVKQNFQSAMIGLFENWKPILSGAAAGLKNFTDWLNTDLGQVGMVTASIMALAGAFYALRAAYLTFAASTNGAKFLSFLPFSPGMAAGIGILVALGVALAAFTKHVDPAVEALEKYNKEMYHTLETLDRTQAGLKQAKFKVDDNGDEAFAMGQYEQAVRKYGMASAEAMELKKKATQVEKENQAALNAGMKEYNAAVKTYGATSRQAMAAKENLSQISAKGSNEETKALKAYDEAVRKHGETSAEAIALKTKTITLTDDTKISLNKLKAEYPAYLQKLDVEKATIADLIKAYGDLAIARHTEEEKDREKYNNEIGPDLWLRASRIRKLKEEIAKATPPEGSTILPNGQVSGAGPNELANRQQSLNRKLQSEEKQYKASLTAAKPIIDRLKNADFKAITYVEGENGGVQYFDNKLTGDKKDPPITQLPKTPKGNTEKIPEYKEHYDAIAEKKKGREELISLIKMDGTTIEELKIELEKIDRLQKELEPMLIADYQNKAREAAVYTDQKDGKTYFKANYAREAEDSLEKIAAWKKYYEANQKSGKSISNLYYDYQQQAAEDKARQEMSKMRADTTRLGMDETKKILGYQEKFEEQMQGMLDSEAEKVIAAQEANAQKIINSAWASEERRARAIIEAKRLANAKIDKETEVKIRKAEDALFNGDESTHTEENLATLQKNIAEIEKGGERLKDEAGRRIDLSAVKASGRIFSSDSAEKQAERDLRIQLQTIALQKEQAWTGKQVADLELQAAQATMEADQKKAAAYANDLATYDIQRKVWTDKLLNLQKEGASLEAQAEIQSIIDDFDDSHAAKLRDIRDKYEDINVQMKVLAQTIRELSDDSFLTNFLKGVRNAMAELTNTNKIAQEFGSSLTNTAVGGTADALGASINTVINPDDDKINSLKVSISSLTQEKAQLESDINTIQMNTSKTPQELTSLNEKKVKLAEINNQLHTQQRELNAATNAWDAFAEGMKRVMKDILAEISKYIARLMVAYMMQKLTGLIAAASTPSGTPIAEAGIGGSDLGGVGLTNATGTATGATGGLVSNSGKIGNNPVHYFSPGGLVPLSAGKAGVDSVNARLMPGEVVIQKSAVDYYGADTLLAYNNKQIQKFASGGMVGGSKSTGTGPVDKSVPYSLTIINVADPNSVPKMTGEEVVNIVSFDAAKKGAIYKTIKGVTNG